MPNTFDVFLSYNHRDKATVRRLVNRLESRGLHVWLDEKELLPGCRWQDALEQLIEEIPSVAIVVGGNDIGPWQDLELRAFLEQSVSRGIPIIPILIKSAGVDARLPLFLRQFMWVDCRDGISSKSLDRITFGITGKKPKGSRVANRVSGAALGLKVVYNVPRRRGRIPYRIVDEGTQGFEHYPLLISLEASAHILDRVLDVEYRLHKAFKRPRRVTSDRAKNFAIEVWAYGDFKMFAIVRFDDGRAAKLTQEINLNLPDDNGTNYILEKSTVGESRFEGCDPPE